MTDFTQLSRRQKQFTLLGTLLGMLLAALDQTIVSTAGPAIQKDLHIQPALYTWLTTSYLVSSAVMTPIWGKLSDLFGRKRILLIGISIFLFGSLLCGISQTTYQLIGARVIQGLGSASLFTTAFAVIADIFTPRERGRYTGVFGAVFGLSSVIGPLVGGFITDSVGWHWCFFINLPVGAIALAVILGYMPSLQQEGRSRSIDYLGSLVFALAVVPLLVALSLGKVELRAGDVGYLWNSSEILGMVAAAVIFGVLFCLVELRAKEPIIDLRMFQNRPYAIGNLASFVGGMAFLGAIVFLPLFMVNVVGASATRAGLTTTPLTFALVLGNILSGQLSSRLGRYKFLILISLTILVGAFSIMAFTLSPEVTSLGMAGRMVLIGLGLGPSIPLFSVHISNAVPPQQIGAATSTATLARSLGSTIGVAIFGNIFGLSLAHSMEQHMATATAGLPPAMVAQLQKPQSPEGAGEEGASSRGSFNVQEVQQRVHEVFAAQRKIVEKAINNDDPIALGVLGHNPMLDENMKRMVAAGGIKQLVASGFEPTIKNVKTLLGQGPEGLQKLLEDKTLAPPLRERLAAISPESLSAPEAREAAIREIVKSIEAAQTSATATARQEALKGANKGLDEAEKTASVTIEKIGKALKEAFSEATSYVYFVAIFFALLSLLVALFLPELPLRGGPPSTAPVE